MFNNKFIFATFITALFMQACFVFSDAPRGVSPVRWITNYDEALQQAQASSKPMVLVFTGSDWCSWCKKLDDEALHSPDFAETVGNRFIFVMLDYPLYTQQDPQSKAKNKQLQQRFDVRSFPTVILFDPIQNQKIGVTGYRAGGGRQYGEHLLKMLNDYSSYKQKMSSLDKAQFSGNDLKHLYDKAKELHFKDDIHQIVQAGTKSDEMLFFLTEQYRIFADEGQIYSQRARELQQELVAADPDNQLQIPYHLAVIEFEANCEELERENYSTEKVVEPLMTYIEKYGEHDKENLWQLQMIISQVYLDKNQMTSALKYAQDSYDSAPSSAQPEIARAIQNIRSQVPSALTATQ